MLAILNRIFVGRFYAQNAGTFLVLILLAFGFLSAVEHRALIMAALGSPFFLALVFLLWSLYWLKTVAFVWQTLTAPEHLFVQPFWLVPTPRRWLLWLLVQTALLLPILAYASWMVTIAATYGQWGPLTAIVLVITGLLLTGASLADYRLRHPNPDALRLPHFSLRLPYELFFPAYWLRHEPLSFLLTKAFSGLLLAGVCRLYPTDDYDQRLLLIGLLLAVLSHAQLAGQVSTFERRYLLFLPNLPLSWRQRLGRYALTYGLIWLPELLLLLRNCPTQVPLPYIGWLWLTGWGWLLFLHGLAYGRDVLPERWLTGVFAGFIGGLLLIMFGLPVGAWLGVGWAGAGIVGRRSLTVSTKPDLSCCFLKN